MEYVCTGATLKCTMGTSCPKLKATPKNVSLTGKDQANIADYVSMKNVPSFGRCRSLGYPPTASATAANHGKLTPMPCVPGTCPKWKAIDKDSLICGEPALLKPATLKCMYGGTISIVNPGQTLEIKVGGVIDKSKKNSGSSEKKLNSSHPSSITNSDNPSKLSLIKNNTTIKDDISGKSITNNTTQSLDRKNLNSGGVVTGGASDVADRNAFDTFMDGVMGVISLIDDKLNKPHKGEDRGTNSNSEGSVNDYLRKRFILCTLNRLFNQIEIEKLKFDDVVELGVQTCYNLSRFPSLIDPIRYTFAVKGYTVVKHEDSFYSNYFGNGSTFELNIIDDSLGDNCYRIGYRYKSGAGDKFYDRRMGNTELVGSAHDGILVREISKGERPPKDLFINEDKVKHFEFKAEDRNDIYLRLEHGKQYYIVAYICIESPLVSSNEDYQRGYMFSNVLHLET